MRRYTLKELVDYSFYNRRGKAFLGWTIQDITNAFIDSLQEGTLLYSVDERGNINGVVHATRFEKDKVLFVGNILATGKGVLGQFVGRFKKMFPGYQLEAQRRQRHIKYRTGRLVKLLTKE